MGSFESKSRTPQEMMRQYKREITKSIREIDKQIREFERQQQKLENDIRIAAKSAKGKEDKILQQRAKDFVRTKRSIEKFYTMRTQLQGVMVQMQTIKSTDALTSAMKNSMQAITAMNRRLNIPQLNKIMQQFAAESAKMEISQDIVGDALDDAMETVDDEAEQEEVVDQVMSELKLDLMSNATNVPTSSAAAMPAASNRVAVGMGAGDAGTSNTNQKPGSGGPSGGFPQPPSSGSNGQGSSGGGNTGGSGAGTLGGSSSGASASNDLSSRLQNLRK